MFTVRVMLVSYVLRLEVQELRSGRLVGIVEDVRSGEYHAIQDAADLVAFCAAQIGREASGSPQARSGEEVAP